MLTFIPQVIRNIFSTSSENTKQEQTSTPKNDVQQGGAIPQNMTSGAAVLRNQLMRKLKNNNENHEVIKEMASRFDARRTELSKQFDLENPDVQLTEKEQKMISLKEEKQLLESKKKNISSEIISDVDTPETEDEISKKIEGCDKEIVGLDKEIANLKLQKANYIVENLKNEFLNNDDETVENASKQKNGETPKQTDLSIAPQQKVQSFTPSTKNGFSNFFGLPPGKMTEIKEKFNQVEAKYKEISNINRQLANPGLDPDEKHVLEKKKSMATREAEQGLQQIEMMHTQAIQEANARLAAFLNMMMDGLKAMLALLKKGGSMQAEAIGH